MQKTSTGHLEGSCRLLGTSDEIIFTRGATEGLNLIAHSLPSQPKGDQIILTEMEHHANIVPWQMIAKSTGAEIVVVPVLQDGSLDQKG